MSIIEDAFGGSLNIPLPPLPIPSIPFESLLSPVLNQHCPPPVKIEIKTKVLKLPPLEPTPIQPEPLQTKSFTLKEKKVKVSVNKSTGLITFPSTSLELGQICFNPVNLGNISIPSIVIPPIELGTIGASSTPPVKPPVVAPVENGGASPEKILEIQDKLKTSMKGGVNLPPQMLNMIESMLEIVIKTVANNLPSMVDISVSHDPEDANKHIVGITKKSDIGINFPLLVIDLVVRYFAKMLSIESNAAFQEILNQLSDIKLIQLEPLELPQIEVPEFTFKKIEIPDIDLSGISIGPYEIDIPEIVLPDIQIDLQGPDIQEKEITIQEVEVGSQNFNIQAVPAQSFVVAPLNIPTIKIPSLTLPCLPIPSFDKFYFGLPGFDLQGLLGKLGLSLQTPTITPPQFLVLGAVLIKETVAFVGKHLNDLVTITISHDVEEPTGHKVEIATKSESVDIDMQAFREGVEIRYKEEMENAFSLPQFQAQLNMLTNLTPPALDIPEVPENVLPLETPEIPLPDINLGSITIPPISLGSFSIPCIPLPSVPVPGFGFSTVVQEVLSLGTIPARKIVIGPFSLPKIKIPPIEIPSVPEIKITIPMINIPAASMPKIDIDGIISKIVITFLKPPDLPLPMTALLTVITSQVINLFADLLSSVIPVTVIHDNNEPGGHKVEFGYE